MGSRSKPRSDRAHVPGRAPGHAQEKFHWDKKQRRYIAGEKPITFSKALESMFTPEAIAERKAAKLAEAAR